MVAAIVRKAAVTVHDHPVTLVVLKTRRRPHAYGKSRAHTNRAGCSMGLQVSRVVAFLSLVYAVFIQKYTLRCVMDGFAHLEHFFLHQASKESFIGLVKRDLKIRHCLLKRRLRLRRNLVQQSVLRNTASLRKLQASLLIPALWNFRGRLVSGALPDFYGFDKGHEPS